MKLLKKKQPLMYRKLFAVIFIIGFLIGILYANIIGKKYIDSSGILSEYFLSHYTYFDFHSNELFMYLLKERVMPCVILWITGVTIVGVPAVWGYLGWMGFSGGMLISMSVMKFGFKGVVLCLAGIIPQYLIYVPAILILTQKVYQVSLGMYGVRSQPQTMNGNKKQHLLQYVWVLFLVLAAFAVGVFLESYVNPYLLKIILKNF